MLSKVPLRARVTAVLAAVAATAALAGGPAGASNVPGVAELGPDPAPRVSAAQQDVKSKQDLVEQARVALEEGQRALQVAEEQSRLFRAKADETRAAATAAEEQAAQAREDLAAVVVRNLKNPPRSTLSIVLDGGTEQLGEAILAARDRQSVVGNQRDLLRAADAARVDAEELVILASQYEADALAAEKEAAEQAERLRQLALDYQRKLEASFALLQQAEADKEAYDSEKARLIELERQRQIAAAKKKAAEEAARAAEQARRNGGVGAGATCDGNALGYPNGFLPASALCSIGGGHRLRQDAAAAFLRMDAAYGGLCVTDSYRSYAAQVDVFRRKPSLAAIPGTSFHGLGIALDLCGGVQRFGSDAHEWMVENAGRFGWYHPTWARQGGSKPEPWHWEYSG